METEYPSGNQAAKALGIDQGLVSKVAHGKRKLHDVTIKFKECKDIGGTDDKS